MAKVSAIVSAYYAEEFIEGRIRNLADQSLKPEIVVVCQRGSKEEIIVNDLGDMVNTIIVTDDIPTVYDAWNMGIEKATGDFITNANSDDRLYPGALAAMYAMLNKKPQYAVAYTDLDIVEEIDGPQVGRFNWLEGGLEELKHGCFLGPMPMWRKSLHDKYGYFNPAFHSAGDYEFWMRLAEGGEKFFHIRQPMGAYLKRKESIEHRESLRSVWETARVRAKYRDELWQ